MKTFLTLPVVLFALAITGCGTNRTTLSNQREIFLEAARRDDPSFPNGKQAKLTFFAHFGTVTSTSEVLHVVFMKEVLTGMLAPRGLSFLMFFDEKFRFVGKQSCKTSPLWCENGYIFMFGEDNYQDSTGNVWDLSNGFLNRRLITKPAYGSFESLRDNGG